MIFKYDEYRKWLGELMSYGKVAGLWEMRNEGKGTFLRHDVDSEVLAAYKLMNIEDECGVSSTYYFLTTTSNYNVNTAKNRKMIKEMSDKGFEVGLHFDPTVYAELKTDEEFEEKARHEARMLEEITGTSVRTYSTHNPSVTGMYPQFSFLLNAYNEKYFNPDFYMSDSRMSFRGKDPHEFIKKAKDHFIQITLHAMQFSENGDDYLDIFRGMVHRQIENIDDIVRPANDYFIKALEGKHLTEWIYDNNNPHGKH